MNPASCRSFFTLLLLLGAGDASAQTCAPIVGTMVEAIQCQRDHCKDLSVANEKGVSKEGIYYVTCLQNYTFTSVRANEPFVAEIDELQRTRLPDPVKVLSPCDCLDKLAKDYPDCKVEVCKPPSKAAPAAPAPPVAAPEETPAPAPSEVAASTPPVEATVVKDSGGCSLIRNP